MTRVITTSVVELGIDELDLRFASLRLSYPAQVAQLAASVMSGGIRQPLLVATEVEPEHRVLVDGFKRVRVARELGIARLSVSLLALDGPGALAMILRANPPQRGMSALEEGWVVRRLCREHGLTQERVGELLGHDQSWVSQRLRLVEHLDEALQQDLRLGLLTPASARELGRLPRSQQVDAAAVAREHGLLSRQVGRLVRSLLATDDPRLRREILADPARTLTIRPADSAKVRTTDSRLSPSGNALRQSLLCFEGAASRLGNSLLSHAHDAMNGEQTHILAPLLRQAKAAGRRVLTQLDEVGREDRCNDAAIPSAPPQGTIHAQPAG